MFDAGKELREARDVRDGRVDVCGTAAPGCRRACRHGDCGSGGDPRLGLVVRSPPGSRHVGCYGFSATVVASTEPFACFGPVTFTFAPFAVATAQVVDV
jgi:hypothetical protein